MEKDLMTDTQPSTDPQTATEPVTPAANQQDGSPDVKDWEAEAKKWQHFSKKHEANWQKATTELAALNQAGMTDAERAVAEAKEQGRKEALDSVITERAQLKLEAAAAKAGVDLTTLMPLLDTSKFLANGDVNDAAINEFVTGYAGSAPKAPKFAQGLGIGPQSDSRAPGQLTREELARLSPRERVQARKDGRLDALLRGEI
ncbi:hypothetical protein ACTMTF_15095 [Nonomuraea sp. ZG12]|uniref:hypothetical protein n=1 Tax=Nonomuraea sp. ZG12 TaxID=3452207 RepID=UPI003F8C931C